MLYEYLDEALIEGSADGRNWECLSRCRNK